MRPGVHLRPQAEAEISEAVSWYAARRVGLAVDFIDELSTTLRRIVENPERFPVAEGEVRRALLGRFPYLVLFRAREEEILVLSCFHTRRDPSQWRSRIAQDPHEP